jgi:hypothetical protein
VTIRLGASSEHSFVSHETDVEMSCHHETDEEMSYPKGHDRAKVATQKTKGLQANAAGLPMEHWRLCV